MRTIPANFTGAKIVTLQLPTKILFTHPVVSLGSIFVFYFAKNKNKFSTTAKINFVVKVAKFQKLFSFLSHFPKDVQNPLT